MMRTDFTCDVTLPALYMDLFKGPATDVCNNTNAQQANPIAGHVQSN